MTLADVLLAVPLGLLAGALAGLLGIGGGLIFAPLLLWMGLSLLWSARLAEARQH